jgi:hypothetical protein
MFFALSVSLINETCLDLVDVYVILVKLSLWLDSTCNICIVDCYLSGILFTKQIICWQRFTSLQSSIQIWLVLQSHKTLWHLFNEGYSTVKTDKVCIRNATYYCFLWIFMVFSNCRLLSMICLILMTIFNRTEWDRWFISCFEGEK